MLLCRNRCRRLPALHIELILHQSPLEPSLSSCSISYCSCLCVSGPLPTPSPWTGSNPRPGTAGGPGPDGALQSGCAGKDCTASLPQWWKDSENSGSLSKPRLNRTHLSLGLFGGLGNKRFLSTSAASVHPWAYQTWSHQRHHSQLSEGTILSLHKANLNSWWMFWWMPVVVYECPTSKHGSRMTADV